VIKTLIHGMTGPLDGRTYPAGVMMPLGANNDQWIAAIASYVRNSFGNRGPFITADDVARVRAATSGRKTMWTPDELDGSVPRMLLAQGSWKVTASHNSSAAPGALTFTTWSTAAPQQPGMWFQVELPDAVRLTEIQFESPGPGGRGGGGRGRAGRGGAGAPPPDGRAATGATGLPVGQLPAAGASAAPQAQADAGQPAPPAFVPPASAAPRGYRVEVSLDGSQWTAVSEGTGSGQSTVIAFEPIRAKVVRITQTATVDGTTPWSVQRLRLYEVGPAR
jgi:hypothetical protein